MKKKNKRKIKMKTKNKKVIVNLDERQIEKLKRY